MKRKYPRAHRVEPAPAPAKHTAGQVAHEVFDTVIAHPLGTIAETAKHAVEAIRTKTPSLDEVRDFARETVTKLNPMAHDSKEDGAKSEEVKEKKAAKSDKSESKPASEKRVKAKA